MRDEGMSGSPVDGQRPALVRVAIPHFYRPDENDQSGYGSSRPDAAIFRAVALARCLGSVLSLARQQKEQMLVIEDASIAHTSQSQYLARQLPGVVIDCHVFVTSTNYLQPELKVFENQITVHHLQLDNPRRLPHAARDFLLKDAAIGSADLSLYLEDDLVIQDRFYIDKLLWFCERTNHQIVLMPHRYELSADPVMPRFFVDGPMDPSPFPNHHQPETAAAKGRFWDGQEIIFDIASNPHSGSFALSKEQRQRVIHDGVIDQGFVGDLETVATFTALQHYPVMKPGWQHRDFLSIEHAHPSYLWIRNGS